MTEPTGPLSRLRRTFWAAIAFLLGACALISFVSIYYLLPAMIAARHADTAGKRQLSAVSTLMLAILLFIVLVGLILAFRVHRFFLPRGSGEKAPPTSHIDAWSESAKRMRIPDPDESESDDE